MASNKLWATGADPGDIAVPGSSLRSAGYGEYEVPSHEHFNWIFQQHGAGITRRYTSVQDFLASEDDLGIVSPVLGAGRAHPGSFFFTVTEQDPVRLASDGTALFVLWGTPGSYSVDRLDRTTGAVLNYAGGTSFYPGIALGRNLYLATKNVSDDTLIQAYDRSTLQFRYQVMIGASEVVSDMVSDGRYVYVAAGTHVRKIEDTGSALTVVANFNNTVAVHSVDTDGFKVVIGAAAQGSGDYRQIRTLTNGLTLTNSASLVSDASVRIVRLCGEGRIAYVSDPDEYSPGNFYYAGLLLDLGASALDILWQWAWNAEALTWTGKYIVFGGQEGSLRILDPALVVDYATPEDGRVMNVYWDAGAATDVNYLCCDGDLLFVTGDADASGKNVKSVVLHTAPRTYAAMTEGTTHYTEFHTRFIKAE